MLSVHSLAIQYPGANTPYVLQDIEFSLEPGDIGCLLGPSGCGKTSLLRTIAGFMRPTAGSISINNETVSSSSKMLAVEHRQIGMVFQDFALFPHMTVAQNIAFGLSHLDKLTRANETDFFVSMVGLGDYKDSFPHQLSGGQQQRVALARALAPRPKLLLLDEPFSNLDIHLREQLALEVRNLLKQLDITAILVTHDQHEAFAVADKIAVLEGGRMHQFGTAYALYHRPATSFVASFIGESVFLPVKMDSEGVLHTPIGEFSSNAITANQDTDLHDSTALRLLVRPDDIIHDDTSPFTAKVIQRRFRGANILYRLQLDADTGLAGHEVLCLAPSHHDHAIGENFGIRLALEHLMVFPTE
ncbi:ABC transporter ATP-binding protein [Alteromonas facilis]|uniref:ABC transporter ATP-binding protein n=1 Tax=Alteromonas facilis TaxID=2048004 RepID=UPI000C290A84|nr:ABC transporter ATP-binding protein [Alteromonas facilis]